MEDLRLAIIVLGVFSILGILAHGLWTIRKNANGKEVANDAVRKDAARKEPAMGNDASDNDAMENTSGNDTAEQPDPLLEPSVDDPLLQSADSTGATLNSTDSDTNDYDSATYNPYVQNESDSSSYDEDGIGAVRTVASGQTMSNIDSNIAEAPVEPSATKEPVIAVDSAGDFPEPPSSLLRAGADSKAETAPAANHKPSFAERAKQLVSGDRKSRKSEVNRELNAELNTETKLDTKPNMRAEQRVEPKLGDDQIRMDFDERQASMGDVSGAEPAMPDEPQEVLVLNVKVSDGKVIHGAVLLPALLTLGFKYGEQEVFHRHAASNGKGPKLFSLANMFKPGTFNLDEMETFETQGISLFMILPIEGDPLQVFNMMHNAARKLADEFGAQILDGRRSLLTKQSLQQYMEKIREFERRRRINRSALR